MEPQMKIEREVAELREITLENNKILNSIQRRQRIADFFRIFYVAFIVLSFYGVYVFAQPYIKEVQNVLSSVNKLQQNVGASAAVGIDKNQINSILEKLNGVGTR